MVEPISPKAKNQKRNDRVALYCAGFVAFMVGASFACIPLYRAFCQATGFDGTPKIGGKAPGAVGAEVFTVRFDANVGPGLPWTFAPAQRQVQIRPGEQKIAIFVAQSESDAPTGGQAVYNVTPDLIGQYFTKVQCFCFNEQHLAAHQKVNMPVSFYIDPAVLKDPDLKVVRSITLSYTFYPAPQTKPQAQLAPETRPDKENWGHGAGRG